MWPKPTPRGKGRGRNGVYQFVEPLAWQGLHVLMDGLRHWLQRRTIRRLRPVVIGGCARSGTSLLLSVLSAHPRLVAIPYETQLLCPGAYWPPAGGIAVPDVDRLYDLLSGLHRPRGCRAWCEKTPRNVLNFEAILETFGRRARLVHIVRDGRDVVLSRHPKKPDDFWVSPERWVGDVQAGLLWREHPQVLTVRYEDLVEDLQSTIHRLCEFLSLEHDARLLDYPRHAQVRESDSWFEPARPLSAKSIGRWRLSENAVRVQQLLEEPGAIRLLGEFGYDV